MKLFDKFAAGLAYADFLERHGSDGDRQRWLELHDRVVFTPAQKQLLACFTRRMHVLCLAGTWCGDCVSQCPIFQRFAAETPSIDLRFLDRDVHADVQAALQINGGNRVPVLVFFSEDGVEAARYGERTLSKYRSIMHNQLAGQCPSAVPNPADPLLAHVTQDWLNEFERIQWLLRLSPRLRQKHGD